MLVAALVVVAVLTAGCGPDKPTGPDLKDFAAQSR